MIGTDGVGVQRAIHHETRALARRHTYGTGGAGRRRAGMRRYARLAHAPACRCAGVGGALNAMLCVLALAVFGGAPSRAMVGRPFSDAVRLAARLVTDERGPDGEHRQDGHPKAPVLHAVAAAHARVSVPRDAGGVCVGGGAGRLRTVDAVCKLNCASSRDFLTRASRSWSSDTGSRPSGRHVDFPSSRDESSFFHAVSQSTVYSSPPSGSDPGSGIALSSGAAQRRAGALRSAAPTCSAVADTTMLDNNKRRIALRPSWMDLLRLRRPQAPKLWGGRRGGGRPPSRRLLPPPARNRAPPNRRRPHAPGLCALCPLCTLGRHPPSTAADGRRTRGCAACACVDGNAEVCAS